MGKITNNQKRNKGSSNGPRSSATKSAGITKRDSSKKISRSTINQSRDVDEE